MSEVIQSFESEMSGILNWAIEGCLLWQSCGLEMVESVKSATAEYKTEQDIVQQFLDEMCEMHPEYSVDKSILYNAFRDWCEDGGEVQAKKKSKNWFTRQMTNRGCEHGGKGKKQLCGLRLK
jgi:putative DNA primase/helicase